MGFQLVPNCYQSALTYTCNLRTRCHDRTIPEKRGHSAEKRKRTSMLGCCTKMLI